MHLLHSSLKERLGVPMMKFSVEKVGEEIPAFKYPRGFGIAHDKLVLFTQHGVYDYCGKNMYGIFTENPLIQPILLIPLDEGVEEQRESVIEEAKKLCACINYSEQIGLEKFFRNAGRLHAAVDALLCLTTPSEERNRK